MLKSNSITHQQLWLEFTVWDEIQIHPSPVPSPCGRKRPCMYLTNTIVIGVGEKECHERQKWNSNQCFTPAAVGYHSNAVRPQQQSWFSPSSHVQCFLWFLSWLCYKSKCEVTAPLQSSQLKYSTAESQVVSLILLGFCYIGTILICKTWEHTKQKLKTSILSR